MGLLESRLPASTRDAFFEETLWLGTTELLCVPTNFGCVIRLFSLAYDGGPEIYRVSKCLSYSSVHIPRYEIEAMGVPRPAVVGVLEREEVHMHAKTGEFISLASWNVTAKTLHWKNEHSHSQGVRAVSAKPLRVVIATQGYMKVQDGTPNPSTERWRQVLSDGRPSNNFTMGRARPKVPEELDLLDITRLGEKAGCAKKNMFDSMQGRPYLGLQLAAIDVQKAQGMEHLLDLDRLELLLVALCWSESTMHAMPDMSASYIEAMNTPVHEQPDAVRDAHWTVDDVESLLHADGHTTPLMLTHWNDAEKHSDQDHCSETVTGEDVAVLVRGMTLGVQELENSGADVVDAPDARENGVAEMGDVPSSP
eukprot:TRINITY_DN36651_c0_g1_i1.p1 TRINITY_DN36651_c0_g1~~TRINITY_DN36651_c0_g1_i1.p1  ORF type:complete len:389 (-),score=58.12 TRINITY_DN36651_c0_g1_i1:85-1182(-)